MTRAPFVLLALPRSRTTWLANWLTRSVGAPCGHDRLVGSASFDAWLEELASGRVCGTVETSGMLGWRLLRQALPKARLGVVRRPVAQVHESLLRQGWTPTPGELEERDALLDVIGRAPGVRSWNFAELSDPEVGASIWTWAHGLAGWDEDRFAQLCCTNVQIDLAQRRRYIFEHSMRLGAMKLNVAARSAKLGGLGCLGLQ